MEKIILIKYGELTTKGDNRKIFINALVNNIKNKLDGINYNIEKNRVRMFIYIDDKDLELVISKLKEVFGIYAFSVVEKVDSDIEKIKKASLNIMKGEVFDTFKVETSRADKSFPIKSPDVSREVGGVILSNIKNKKVDVHNPNICLNIEIRVKYTYLYIDNILGLGGYPVGTLGKGLLMLSGGIDSPVAGFLALKRGIRLETIYFESPPHTSDEALEKVISLAKTLSIYGGDIKLHIISLTKIQEAIYKNLDYTYMITILRRMMYRISEKVALKNKNLVLINGESIGQVASQTLASINAIEDVVLLPVIRPVACLDKIEIINIAKKIKTYETSILPYEDCCTVFVPKHPTTNPLKSKCIELEKKLDYEEMIKYAIDNMKTIKVKRFKEKDYSDLL